MPTSLAALAQRQREHFHACAFVTGPAEEIAVIDPFLEEGMCSGEKAVYIVDPAQRDSHYARLASSEMDGYALARTLRAEHGGGPTLIAATGYGQKKDRLLATAAGFDCHFVKPVSIQDLIVVLDERVVGRDAATR